MRRVIALLGIILAAPALACGPPAVCGDVNTSLTGQILVDGIRLQWSTDDEGGDAPRVASYKIRRYDCGDPAICSVLVATVGASGTCGETASHSYTESPIPSGGPWAYTVEAWTTAGQRACAVDVLPQ